MNIEEKFNRLNEIVSKIEDKDIDLDESLKLYEEGKKLIEELSKILNDAVLKIYIVEILYIFSTILVYY